MVICQFKVVEIWVSWVLGDLHVFATITSLLLGLALNRVEILVTPTLLDVDFQGGILLTLLCLWPQSLFYQNLGLSAEAWLY